jgi:hypothetical protein
MKHNIIEYELNDKVKIDKCPIDSYMFSNMCRGSGEKHFYMYS